MRRLVLVFLLVLVFVSSGYGVSRLKNWNGFADTTSVTDFDSDSVKYGATWDLGAYDSVAVVVMVNDTDAAGFGSDSIGLRYGWQLGYPVMNGSGVRDTVWTPRAVNLIDTVVSDSLGKIATATNWVDTLQVSGWAVQARSFSTQYAPAFRYWVEGIGDNNTGSPLELRVVSVRRLYQRSGD